MSYDWNAYRRAMDEQRKRINAYNRGIRIENNRNLDISKFLIDQMNTMTPQQKQQMKKMIDFQKLMNNYRTRPIRK